MAPSVRAPMATPMSAWALKNPEDLTETQASQLARIRRNRGGIWRAYEMKEQFRAILAGDLSREQAAVLLDRWCARGAAVPARSLHSAPRPCVSAGT